MLPGMSACAAAADFGQRRPFAVGAHGRSGDPGFPSRRSDDDSSRPIPEQRGAFFFLPIQAHGGNFGGHQQNMPVPAGLHQVGHQIQPNQKAEAGGINVEGGHTGHFLSQRLLNQHSRAGQRLLFGAAGAHQAIDIVEIEPCFRKGCLRRPCSHI
ncbi:hypothetical protein D3C75_852880 [compost metagenome]